MSSAPGFAAGFVARHDPHAQAQLALIANDPFAPADLKARATHGRRPRANPNGATESGPRSFSPQPVGPRHFSPEPGSDGPHDGNPPQDAGGFVDAIAQARAQAFAEGMAHARDLAVENGDRDAALLASLATALQSPDRINRDTVARQLRETVLFLVTKMIGEIGVPADLLAARVEAAATLLADHAESAVLRVHPDDVALLHDKLPPMIFPVGDANVSRGSFVLEAASTIVEEGPELWLEQLATAIDRVALPSSC